MASQEVLTALEKLHFELEKLEPAIKHVETAQQITQTVKGIPQKHIELLKAVSDSDAKHKADLKSIFSSELSILSKGNEQLLQTSKLIDQRNLSLLKEVKEQDLKHKGELKDLFSKELISITAENKKLSQTTSDIQKEVLTEQEALSKVREAVQKFHDRIERINFPERLDKLDNNIAGIMAALQAVQSRLDSLERNLADRIKDVLEYERETRTALQLSFEKTQAMLSDSSKIQKIMTYTTWGLITLLVAILFLVKLKIR